LLLHDSTEETTVNSLEGTGEDQNIRGESLVENGYLEDRK
jgi:hypothetical protein